MSPSPPAIHAYQVGRLYGMHEFGRLLHKEPIPPDVRHGEGGGGGEMLDNPRD